MSQLSVMLQETVRQEREATRTLLEILRDQMDGADGGPSAGRRSFKQRLGFNGFGCCGATWGFGGGRTAAIGIRDDNGDDEEYQQPQSEPQQRLVVSNVAGPVTPVNHNWDPGWVGPVSTGSGMNLAAALAAERQFRAPQDPEGGASVGPTEPGTPMRVSLMRLLEETDMDGCDAFGGGGGVATAESEKGADGGGVGSDNVCCVCMGRMKGAAFIPCGHTFCRVCSREVWLNRGSCPLCNRSILEILDIY